MAAKALLFFFHSPGTRGLLQNSRIEKFNTDKRRVFSHKEQLYYGCHGYRKPLKVKKLIGFTKGLDIYLNTKNVHLL